MLLDKIYISIKNNLWQIIFSPLCKCFYISFNCAPFSLSFFQFHDLYIPKQIISCFDKMKKSQRKTIYQDSLVNLEIWNNTLTTLIYLSVFLSPSFSLSQSVSVSLFLSLSLSFYLSLSITLFPHLYFSILNYLIISSFGMAIFYYSIIFLFTKKKTSSCQGTVVLGVNTLV